MTLPLGNEELEAILRPRLALVEERLRDAVAQLNDGTAVHIDHL